MAQYKGFDLFNDIEDNALRTRNRAVVLANIAEDNMKQKKVSPKGLSLILGYFNLIPDAEKNSVKNKWAECMRERGHAIAG